MDSPWVYCRELLGRSPAFDRGNYESRVTVAATATNACPTEPEKVFSRIACADALIRTRDRKLVN